MSVVVPEKIPNIFMSTFKVAMKMNGQSPKQAPTPTPSPPPSPTPLQSPPPTPLDFSNGSRMRGSQLSSIKRTMIIVLEIHQLPKLPKHPNRPASRGVRKERRRK